MLKYHNDGKEKSQSHEVYDSDFDDIPTGYGENKKDAFHEYKNNVNEYIDNLKKYAESKLNIDEAISVDCFGYPIEPIK